MPNHSSAPARRHLLSIVFTLFCIANLATDAGAHPLGNFTVNHYARLELDDARLRVRYVVDMAEIASFQELQQVDADADGQTSEAELQTYARRMADEYAGKLLLSLDGVRVPLAVTGQRITLPPGEGGLPTLRLECDFDAALPATASSSATGAMSGRLQFRDANHEGRLGWREIVVAPRGGVRVFNSTAFGNGLTNELREYPEDKLAAPLNEQAADLSFTTGALVEGATLLKTREGKPVAAVARDRFAELINVRELTPGVALVGLLFAAVLGGFHALSPGHGKAVVAAYLIGSRGTAKHAAFLGLTVTITHTSGVIALGIATLFAAQYVVPERLFPILSLISGAIVVLLGASLLVKRLSAALGLVPPEHTHHHHDDGGHTHYSHAQQHEYESTGGQTHEHTHHDHTQHEHADHEHVHHDHIPHDHAHDKHAADEHIHREHAHDGELTHSHGGGRVHSHLPPGTEGAAVTWRSLLALGVSGGLLPCPSALVVMLSAITLGRIGYGLLLVLAFSFGLAGVLTGIGLLFVYARRFMARPLASAGGLLRVLPVFSALVITVVGVAICYQAYGEGGAEALASLGSFFPHDEEMSFASRGALAILGFGLIFGLRHATEVDHVIAVSTIVSEHRKLWRSALVGGLWGAGHTASLMLVGAFVLVLRIAIPERVGEWLEFGVALMIIILGLLALARAFGGRAPVVHVHGHQHDGQTHAHVHFHEPDGAAAHDEETPPPTTAAHSHHVSRIGFKPLVVGAIHGLAGSATLTLLVLTQINSTLLGLLYLAVFGLGSIIGMVLMSGLIGLPFAYSSRSLAGFNRGLQTVAGILSICFGLWYAYEKGIANGLLTAAL